MKAKLFIVFLFNCFGLFAQNSGSVSGIVSTADSAKPIPNVDIFIGSLKMGTVTSENGYFEIKSIPSGQYEIEFTLMGYESKSVFAIVNEGENTNIEISLNPRIKRLDEVVIEDTYLRFDIISRMPYVKSGFTRFHIEEEATRDVGDYLRSSKNISGIRKGGTQIDPVVRGFKFGQLNVILNNGQKIEGGCPNRMDPATAHVEIEDIESIDVIKGPYNLRYGPAFGGLINLSTADPLIPDMPFIKIQAMKSFESNWNGNKEHLAVTGGNKWGFISLSGGRKDFGNYKDGNGNEVKSAFKKYNFGGHIGLRPFKDHLLLISVEESKGRDIRFPALPMDERKDDTELISADYQIQSGGSFFDFINLKAYQSKVRHEMDNKYRPFSDTTVAISIIHAQNSGGRAEIGIQTVAGELILGVDYENIQKDGQRDKNMILQPGLPVKKEKLWNNAAIQNAGFFAMMQGGNDIWKYNWGIRIDRNSATSDAISITNPAQGEIYNYGQDSIGSNFTNFSLNGGVTRKLKEHLSLSFAVGRGVRSPDMTERFIILLPIGYDQFDYLGNPQLKPEVNNQVDLTAKYSHERLGDFQLNGFYAIVNDFITGRRLAPSVQKPLSKDVLGVKQFYNAGNAQIRGFEFSYALPAENRLGLAIFASYTYGTLNESRQYILNATGEVVDDQIIIDDALTEIPPFESTLSVYYRFFKGRFLPKLKIRAVAAQNHVSQASYENITPGFVVTGMGFTYLLNQYFTVTGGVNNLFDKAYYEHLNRNIIGSDRKLYEPGRSFYINLYFKF